MLVIVGYVGNVQEAKAFVALMQLRQLRNAWVGDWEPDWKDLAIKRIITYINDSIITSSITHCSHPISFPTLEMAEEFYKCFNGLLEQAKILL